MKQFSLAILLGCILIIMGCGDGSSNRTNINGNWNAALSNTDGSEAFGFTTSFNSTNGNSSLTISNFTFTTEGGCFDAPTAETGSFTFAGDFNGNVTGTFQMAVTATLSDGTTNDLTMQGTVNGTIITGDWVLTGGPGCSGNGGFTMTRM